jgi:hypothetical protein
MVEQLQGEVEELKAENKRLGLRVQVLERELYGSRSDKRPKEDSNQETFPSIDAGTEGAAPEPEAVASPTEKPARRKERKGKKKGPKPLNPDLPRVDETISDPDLNELICPITGHKCINFGGCGFC